MLLGRDAELETALSVCHAAAEGRGGVLTIVGEPGIGKTALLAAVADECELTIVRATAVEAERAVAFATLQALLWPLRHDLGEVERGQADILRGTLRLGPPSAASAFAVGAATLSLVSIVAERTPLVVIVDDVHWADEASQDACLFVARRLEREPVALLVGVREGEASPFEDESAFGRVDLRGLPEQEARAVLAAVDRDLASSVVDELLAMCAGNPLGLVELPRALSEEERRGEVPLASRLPSGPLVQRAFSARLEALDDRARQAALMLAAVGEARVDLLVHAGVERGAIAALEESGLIVRRAERLTFRHPLAQTAVYAAAKVGERRDAHRRLAGVLDGARRAWQLAEAADGPDAHVADALEEAAEEARAAGGVAAQAQGMERAADLTSDDEDRARRLIEAALAWKRAGRIAHAEALLDKAAELARDPEHRARVVLERGNALIARYEERAAYDLLVAEAESAITTAPKLATRLLVYAQLAAVIAGDPGDALHLAERARSLAGGDADYAELEAVNALHSARMLRPVPPRHEDLALVARSAEVLERLELRSSYDDAPWIAYCLALHERDGEARALSDVVLRESRATGDVWMLAYALFARAALEQAVGRLDTARGFATEGVALAAELGEPWRLSEANGILAEVESGCADVDACRAALDAMARPDERGALRGLGFASLGAGRFQDAVALLERANALDQHGVARAWYHQLPLELSEAYACVGRVDEATALLDALAPGIERAPLLRPRAAFGRLRALVAPPGCVDEAFAGSLTALEQAPHPLLRARTELCWGERLTRDARGDEGADHLAHALTAFEALGAPGWASRTRAALRAAGQRPRPARPRRIDVLTPQELRIARHAAAGLRDREIAARLFVSPRTVHSHLWHAYRKLDVSNRTQLAGVLAADGVSPLDSSVPEAR